jgi:hypothetical protein
MELIARRERNSGAHVNVTSKSNPSPDSGPRRQLLSHGPEADALLDQVREAMGTLSKLLSHGRELGESVTHVVQRALADVSAKVDRTELRVAVVGEERSGKSTFLDALLGERLLGMTKTPPNLVTTIRSMRELGYRAELTDGFIDDFAVRDPDQTAKRLTEIESTDARLGEAKRRSVAAAVEVAAAADALERLETSMTESFRAFEAAREDAARASANLATSQDAWGRLCTDAAERAKALPALFRQHPPWWALWTWIIRLCALLLHWRSWRGYRALAAASGRAEAEVDALRGESSRAAERCWQAEAKLSTANVPVEQARRSLETARQVAQEAEAACATLGHELIEKRLEMERARSDRKRRFFAEVMALCNMDDRGKDVVDLEIDYPAGLLPDDILLIETPGVSSDDVASSERAWRAIRERADACIVISELEHAVSGETQKFLPVLREAVPHAILVLTKMDETLTEATRRGDADPAEQVQQACRIGTRRFAREMGRDPNAVLSLTVAAEEALRHSASSEPDRRRFEADVAKLFRLLHYERALILGASAAGIVRRCIRDLADAEGRAALAHRERIATLEAQRIPNPEQFFAEQMKSIDGVIAEKTKEVMASAASVLNENAGLARAECKTKIASCATKDDLRALVPELAEMSTRTMAAAAGVVRMHLDAKADRSVRDIEQGVFQALKERYYILHQITRPADLRVGVAAELPSLAGRADLAPQLDEAMRAFDRQRWGFGIGGAVAGAGMGTLVLPGIGSLAGALVGGLLTLAKPLGALKQAFGAATDECLTRLERAMAEQVAAAEPMVATAMHAALKKSLEQVLARFAHFIDEPIEEERAAIEGAREKLRELEMIHARLQEHDAHLESLIKSATEASVGLCR